MNNKCLIAYFSHRGNNYVNGKVTYLETGNTEVVAQKIARIVEGDLFYIETKEPYPEAYDAVAKQASIEMREDARPQLKNTLDSIEAYDTIYLGFPNWCGTMPMVVWTFLESFDFTNKNIYAFCTHEGSSLGNSERDLRKLCPSAIHKQAIAIKGSSVHEADESIRQWLTKK